MGKKKSKEIMMERIAQAMPRYPSNRGYMSMNWQRKMLDGKMVTVYSFSEESMPGDGLKLDKEFTDVEEFKSALVKKIDSFVEE